MPCYSPYIRIETQQKIIKKNGELSNKAIIMSETEFINTWKNKIPKEYIQKIPCGQCIGCRLEYSRQWANRITLETKKYKPEESWFLTLTYNDENIPIKIIKNKITGEIIQGTTLSKKDIQNFFKKTQKTLRIPLQPYRNKILHRRRIRRNNEKTTLPCMHLQHANIYRKQKIQNKRNGTDNLDKRRN